MAVTHKKGPVSLKSVDVGCLSPSLVDCFRKSLSKQTQKSWFTEDQHQLSSLTHETGMDWYGMYHRKCDRKADHLVFKLKSCLMELFKDSVLWRTILSAQRRGRTWTISVTKIRMSFKSLQGSVVSKITPNSLFRARNHKAPTLVQEFYGNCWCYTSVTWLRQGGSSMASNTILALQNGPWRSSKQLLWYWKLACFLTWLCFFLPLNLYISFDTLNLTES